MRHRPPASARRWWMVACALAAIALSVALGIGSSTRAAVPLRAALPSTITILADQDRHPPPPPPPTSPQDLHVGEGLAWAHPPMFRGLARTPVTVFLHGACGDPAPGCALLSKAATTRGWLLCPTGPRRCGRAWDWSGSGADKRAHLEASIANLTDRWPGHVGREGHVLVGFSRGAFAARDILYAGARFRGVIFIGAAFIPDPEKLRARGVRRVVLACGDHDGARPTMVKATAVLLRAGVQARFMSMGPTWHQLPADSSDRLAESLAWVSEPPPAT